MTSELHHLAAAYALDALDEDERAAFEAHYPSCDVCAAEVADFRSTAAELAEDAWSAPPPDLKTKIMSDVSRTRQVPPILPDRVVDLAERRRRRASRSTVLGAAAAALVVIVGVVFAVRDSQPTDLEALVAARDAVRTELDATAAGADGSIEIIWSAQRDAVAVIGDGLDDPGAGMAYQLWFVLGDDGVAPAGLFDPASGSIEAVLDVDDIDGAGWGVTIEPETGSEQPTNEILFLGSISA